MKSVFIVMGVTGEYSDRSEWAVAAYATREMAEEHEMAATMRAEQIKKWTDANGREWRWSPDPAKPANEYDSKFSMDYTGTNYFTMEVPFRAAPPQGT